MWLERKPKTSHKGTHKPFFPKPSHKREGFQKILSMNVHDRNAWCDVGDDNDSDDGDDGDDPKTFTHTK